MVSTRRVSEHEIRTAFNNSGLYERAQAGELLVSIESQRPGPAYNQPPGTASQTITYHDVIAGQLVKVAVCHAFVLPDGTINNARRRPDPKFLLVDDEVLMLQRPQRELPIPIRPPPRPSN